MHIVIVDEDSAITGTANSVIERYEGLSKASDARTENGELNYYVEVVNAKSNWVWWLNHPSSGASNWGNAVAGITFTAADGTAKASLANGAR